MIILAKHCDIKTYGFLILFYNKLLYTEYINKKLKYDNGDDGAIAELIIFLFTSIFKREKWKNKLSQLFTLLILGLPIIIVIQFICINYNL